MAAILPLAVSIAMLAVAAVLLRGIFRMARGRDTVEHARKSNRLMWWRVILQTVALILALGIAVAASR